MIATPAVGHVQLRGLELSDLEPFAALERVAQASPWSERQLVEELQHADARVLGAFDGEALVGFAAYRSLHDELWLLNVAVHPRVRRRGVGRSLLEAGRALGGALGASAVWLEVRASNAGARALYLGVGFVEVGVRTGYYPPGPGAQVREDAVQMTLALPGC